MPGSGLQTPLPVPQKRPSRKQEGHYVPGFFSGLRSHGGYQGGWKGPHPWVPALSQASSPQWSGWVGPGPSSQPPAVKGFQGPGARAFSEERHREVLDTQLNCFPRQAVPSGVSGPVLGSRRLSGSDSEESQGSAPQLHGPAASRKCNKLLCGSDLSEPV